LYRAERSGSDDQRARKRSDRPEYRHQFDRPPESHDSAIARWGLLFSQIDSGRIDALDGIGVNTAGPAATNEYRQRKIGGLAIWDFDEDHGNGRCIWLRGTPRDFLRIDNKYPGWPCTENKIVCNVLNFPRAPLLFAQTTMLCKRRQALEKLLELQASVLARLSGVRLPIKTIHITDDVGIVDDFANSAKC